MAPGTRPPRSFSRLAGYGLRFFRTHHFRPLMICLMLVVVVSGFSQSGAVAFDPEVQPASTLLDRGNDLYRKGEYQKAIILYKKAYSRGGDAEAASFNMGNCYYREGDLGRAAAAYQKALRVSGGDNTSAMQNLAGVYFRLGEFGKSIALYRRYLKKQPREISAWIFLADAYRRTGDLLSAQFALEKAHWLDASDVSILYQLAEIHVNLGEPGAAIKLIETAYAKNPGEIDFLFYIGDLFRAQEDYASAAAQYRKGLSLRPNDADVLYKLADVLERDGKNFLAMDFLQRALAQKSDFSDAAIFLGNIAFDLKMWERSGEAYLKAIRLGNLEGVEGIRNIAFEYQKLGYLEESLKLLENALEAAPDNLDLQLDLDLYQRSKDAG